MADGSSAALVVSEAVLRRYNLTPIARVHALAVTAGDPVIMLEEPIAATARGTGLGSTCWSRSSS